MLAGGWMLLAWHLEPLARAQGRQGGGLPRDLRRHGQADSIAAARQTRIQLGVMANVVLNSMSVRSEFDTEQ